MIKQIHEKDITTLYHQLKHSANKRGISFDLTLTDLNNLTFPLVCPILNIPIFYHTGKSKGNSASIDRIDSRKGYTIDNIIVISNRANKIKSDATLEELQLIVNFYSNL
jgi:hypothetical protein